MSNEGKRTRVYLSAEKFFRITGNHGTRFLETLHGERAFFEELMLLVNRGYLQNRALTPEDIAMSINRETLTMLLRKVNLSVSKEEAMDTWISLLIVGYDAFEDELYTVIDKLHHIEGTIKIPHLSINVMDIDTTPDEDLILFITYDYLPF